MECKMTKGLVCKMQDGATFPNVLAKWFYEKWMDVQSGDHRQP